MDPYRLVIPVLLPYTLASNLAVTMLNVLTAGNWLTRECYKIQRRKPTARQTWCLVDTVKKLPASCSGWLQQKEHFFRQICFEEFFALLWASLNVHRNCVVQNTAWSRNAALLDLTMHSPSFLSEWFMLLEYVNL